MSPATALPTPVRKTPKVNTGPRRNTPKSWLRQLEQL